MDGDDDDDDDEHFGMGGSTTHELEQQLFYFFFCCVNFMLNHCVFQYPKIYVTWFSYFLWIWMNNNDPRRNLIGNEG